MNRTDRLYALVEELRAVAPRPRSAAWLARRFEVSSRTIERDLEGLRQSGVPIWSEPGRAGGYAIDRERTLPPLAFTPGEALAIQVGLRAIEDSPFAEQARSAALKVLGGLPEPVRSRERALAGLVHRVGHGAAGAGSAARSGRAVVMTRALEQNRMLWLRYTDRGGQVTEREVEPLGLLWGPGGWYLLAYCRLRQAVRGFVLEQVDDAQLRDEQVSRSSDDLAREVARLDATSLGL